MPGSESFLLHETARLRMGSVDSPRIPMLFFGTTGSFSLIVLDQLLQAGLLPLAVIVPDPTLPELLWLRPAPSNSPIALQQPAIRRSVIERAWEHAIPVAAAGRLTRRAIADQIIALGAALACVACFPWRVPVRLLEQLTHGALNVHPALLPAHRGPAPLFWALQAGELALGATIHWMDAGLDTGPIARQQQIELPEGISHAAAEHELALLGGQLLVETLQEVANGRHTRRAQGLGASYEPWPTRAHFTLEQTWPARRAFIFLRGAAEWGHPFLLSVPEATLVLEEALGYDPAATIDVPFRQTGDQLQIAMTPGVLRARGRLL
jgi:methionyl-tRNA formyltransferase